MDMTRREYRATLPQEPEVLRADPWASDRDVQRYDARNRQALASSQNVL